MAITKEDITELISDERSAGTRSPSDHGPDGTTFISLVVIGLADA